MFNTDIERSFLAVLRKLLPQDCSLICGKELIKYRIRRVWRKCRFLSSGFSCFFHLRPCVEVDYEAWEERLGGVLVRNLRTKIVYWVNVSEGSGTDSPGLSQTVMLTRTFHQGPGPGPGLGCQGTGPGQGLHSQGPGQGQGLEQMWSHQCEHSRHLN